MMSRYVTKYSELIAQHLTPTYVRFPRSAAAMNRTKIGFSTINGFPGILGVVDGTHIAIKAVPNDIEIPFMNRKGFHSVNVQIVCNADMLITNINARFPGSTHDSFIFGGSVLYTHLEQLYQTDPNTFNFLIGTYNY